MAEIPSWPLPNWIYMLAAGRHDAQMTHVMRCWMAFTLLACTLAPPVGGEDTELIIDGVAIKLGMPQAEATKALQKEFNLLPTGDSYTIDTKAAPHKILGGISFKDDKVSSIQKRWGEYSGRGVTNLAQALLGTLDVGARSTAVAATVTIRSGRTPDLTLNIIDIALGNKTVMLLVTEDHGPKYASGVTVSVDESLK